MPAPHLHGLAVADEQAGAAEAAVGAVAAAAVCLADAVCGGAAAAAAGAVLLPAELLLAAEVAGDACDSTATRQTGDTGRAQAAAVACQGTCLFETARACV
jgi:hypothetical protein